MDYKLLVLDNLITDNTKELTKNKIFLKTDQNSKYATNIKEFITPKELLQNINTKFIGITGTNGKTTTAFVLGYLLQKVGFKVGVQGTEGFFVNGIKKEDKSLTTPPILTTIKRAFRYDVDFFVMEVSSHAIAQNRIEGINFFLKIFTSFSQDHLDFHKNMNEYKKVKESFFKDDVIKIVNGKLKKDFIEIGGFKFDINKKNLYLINKPLIEDIPLAGEFNKINFSLAIKAYELLTNKKEIDFSDFKGVSGRMEIVYKNPLIIIDFAHTPDGMQKVLSSISSKKIVVFGAGGNRDKKKRSLMGEVADKFSDFIILTEDNPRCENVKDIIDDIKKGIKKTPYKIVYNRKDAIKEAIKIAKEKNFVLFILGKGDESYIEYCDKKIPFNDREVIKEILKIN